jgi:hypothetical protein
VTPIASSTAPSDSVTDDFDMIRSYLINQMLVCDGRADGSITMIAKLARNAKKNTRERDGS